MRQEKLQRESQELLRKCERLIQEQRDSGFKLSQQDSIKMKSIQEFFKKTVLEVDEALSRKQLSKQDPKDSEERQSTPATSNDERLSQPEVQLVV